MSIATPLVTPDDLALMEDAERLELIDGMVVEKEMSNKTSKYGGRIYSLLEAFSTSKSLGVAYPDGVSYRCFTDPTLVRKPDVSYFTSKRWTADLEETTHIESAPDLIVEVVSPNDVSNDLFEKIQQFFDAGTSEAWIVHPTTRQVDRRFSDGRARWYKADEIIEAEPLISGFSFRLADVIPTMKS